MRAISGAIHAFRSGEGLKAQLLRGGVGSVAIKIGSTGLNVLLAIVLARALGAEGFGVYSFVFALITIMAIPAQMGLPNLVVRETAKAQAAGDWALMKGLWRWSTLMALMMSAALMAIGALAAWAFSSHLPQGGLTVFYWGLVLVPLVALGNLRGAALRGLRHVVQGQLPEFILRPAFFIALVLGAHFGLSTHALTASDAMMLHAVASLVAFVIGAWLLLRVRPIELKGEMSSKRRQSLWLKSAIPLGANDGMHLINGNLGIIALGLFSDATEVAIFRIAFQAASMITFGQTVVVVVVMPYFSRLYADQQTSQLNQLAVGSCIIAASVGAPIALSLVLFGTPFLATAFGPEFTDAYWPLVILIFGQLAIASMGILAALLNMTGRERHVSWGLLASVTSNVVLTAALVPIYGGIGAAVATSASFLVWNTLVAYAAFKLLRFHDQLPER